MRRLAPVPTWRVIDGNLCYSVLPVCFEDETVLRAWRLRRGQTIYNVADATNGAVCGCADFSPAFSVCEILRQVTST